MMLMKKNFLIAALTVITLLLVLFMPSSVQGADYSRTDPENDVTKLSYSKGVQTSITENVAKEDVDMTAIDINWNPSLIENSTIVVTYAGTPAVDEYHSLGIGVNITVHLNDSYYVGIGLSLLAGVTFSDSVDAFVLFGYGLYNQTGDPVVDDQYYFPVLIGMNTYDISYSISGNSITYSFGFTDDEAELLDTIASPASTEFNDLTAFSYASDTPYWNYLENDTSTVWFDVYPNDGDTDGNGDGTSDTGTEGLNDTNADNPLASLTPGFATPLTVVALLSIVAIPLIRKHRKKG